jgi:hypothetical protein
MHAAVEGQAQPGPHTKLITHMDSRPRQHKDYNQGKLMTAIAIGIMIIATAYAACSNRHWHNNIQDIQHGTATQQGGHGQQDQSGNNKQTTKHDTRNVRNTRKTGNKANEARHLYGAERNLCPSPNNEKLQASEGTPQWSAPNTQKFF